MNCPACRRHLWFEPALSNTNKGKDFHKVYACGPCSTLYVFVDFPTKVMGRGVGVIVLRGVKASGYSIGKGPLYGSQRGES